MVLQFFKKDFHFPENLFQSIENVSKFQLIVTQKDVYLSNGGLFWKSLVPFLRRTYPLSVGYNMKPIRKAFSSVKTKTNPNFARKICGKEQPFIFTVYFMNHIFETYVQKQPSSHYGTELRHKFLKCARSAPAMMLPSWIRCMYRSAPKNSGYVSAYSYYDVRGNEWQVPLKIYFLKNANETCKPNNRDWIIT